MLSSLFANIIIVISIIVLIVLDIVNNDVMSYAESEKVIKTF